MNNHEASKAKALEIPDVPKALKVKETRKAKDAPEAYKGLKMSVEICENKNTTETVSDTAKALDTPEATESLHRESFEWDNADELDELSDFRDFSELTEIEAETDSDGALQTNMSLITVDTTERLDKLIAEKLNITRTSAASLIENGGVTDVENGIIIGSKSIKLPFGKSIRVILPKASPCEALPQDIPIEIQYEDDELLIVNKPRGMVVHPAPGNPDGTLVNALLFHCQGRLSAINGVIRPGIVHRIDKDTSGLLIVAKNDDSHVKLAEQIKAHSFDRIYFALVYGNVKNNDGVVDLPIGRSQKDRKKMAVTDKNSRNAVTHYTVLERFCGYTLLRCKLETGRTHQIRVHMSHIGHAVVGDPLYAPNGGKNEFGLVGQCLHAKYIGFIHPKTNKYVAFDSELPRYFSEILEKLRKKQTS